MLKILFYVCFVKSEGSNENLDNYNNTPLGAGQA